MEEGEASSRRARSGFGVGVQVAYLCQRQRGNRPGAYSATLTVPRQGNVSWSRVPSGRPGEPPCRRPDGQVQRCPTSQAVSLKVAENVFHIVTDGPPATFELLVAHLPKTFIAKRMCYTGSVGPNLEAVWRRSTTTTPARRLRRRPADVARCTKNLDGGVRSPPARDTATGLARLGLGYWPHDPHFGECLRRPRHGVEPSGKMRAQAVAYAGHRRHVCVWVCRAHPVARCLV